MNGKVLGQLTLVAFIISVIIAGFNFIAVRYSNDELAPFWGAALRFGIASCLLFIIVMMRRLPLPKGKALIGCFKYGVLGFGASYAFAYWGLLGAPSGIAAVIIALVPLLTFFLALLNGLEQFRARSMIGALLASVGIFIVFNEQIKGSVAISSLLALLGAAFSIAGTNIVVKKIPKINPISMNAVAMATGAILLFLISTVSREPIIFPQLVSTWLALVYLVLIGSIVLFLLYVYVISRWSASATAYQLVLAPLVTIPVALLLRNETVTLIFVLGSALALIGTYVGAILITSSKT